jgi:uncharacterized protein YecA (UPF0149 family)
VQQTLAVGWFPASEWEQAVDRWPDLVEELPREHGAYLAAIEARMADVSSRATGTRLVMVALTVNELDQRAAADDLDGGSPELRGRVASTLAQSGGGTVWPPARNEPCWCASGLKYKHCCGSTRKETPLLRTT